MTLPTPRNLLTSLLTTLATPTPAPTPTHGAPALNPLRNAPADKTALLSTIHVIFPSLLLPALDLLDRGLVTGIQAEHDAEEGVSREASEAEGRGGGLEVGEGREAAGSGEGEGTEGGDEGTEGVRAEAQFYVVKSLASTMRRKARVGRYYLVTLRAWNCTCPSFTLDAFPPARPTKDPAGDTEHGTRAGTGGGVRGKEEGEHVVSRGREDEGSWSFGGSSADGLGIGRSVPCCKHLLACVLTERWGDVLGSFVPVKSVRKGEIAGLAADV